MPVQQAGLSGSEKALLDAQVTICAHKIVRNHGAVGQGADDVFQQELLLARAFSKSSCLCNGALHGCENRIVGSDDVPRHDEQAQELRMQKERVIEHEQRIKEQEAQIARLDRMLKDVINQQQQVLFAPIMRATTN